MTTSEDKIPKDEDTAATSFTPRRAPLHEIGRLIHSRIGGSHGLQARYLKNESGGRASVAILRKALNLAPGESPEIWELTQVRVPHFTGDEPTKEELAVHTSMTLYALHQQSRTEAMYKPGQGLGYAARRLVGTNDENSSTRARFNSLVTSSTFSELRHHLRAFISQLRAAGIALDYASLADDLVRFQTPGGTKSVRLRWSRQYASFPYPADSYLEVDLNDPIENLEN
ncbi:type I-E CRISPR-associated protein Cse2/CasB [Schaalia vaccimaxillae]|uniref:type I-E CRISPR-associated protein Cse2/CasB n=1 Tax=Schaalia vaccimaxillae TaxID=183916 RepID=UPI0003B6DF94|nr:type I-E CRISPR-associated protein Cse2/CasB [Schaalia vaccimaxillae]